MKRNWIRTDRLWCLFLILAVSRVTESSSKTIDQVKLPIPTKETLPQLAEALKAASYLEENDELEKNFEGPRVSYKRSPRKLETDDLDKSSELQEYQGVMGRPGVDFPILTSIPHTDFSCKKVKKPGYYADPETDCQVFHICDNGRKVSFLCPNGTIFRQSHLICDWWFRVDCERSVELYEESAEQLATDQRVFRERAEALAKSMLKVQTTTDKNNRVVTERSFGPSTTIFNSESRLPERARYFNSHESQVVADTSSFVKNPYQTNFNNNFFSQTEKPIKNWNTGNFQSSNYQPQSTTTAQSIWNQAVNNNNYQNGHYQAQSTTTAQTSNVQGINDFQYSYQPQYTTIAQSIKNQDVTTSQVTHQSQPTTVTPQINWNKGNNNYQTRNFYTQSVSAATQTNWNNPSTNSIRTENYQSYSPSTTQTNWNQNNYQSVNYQTPSTTVAIQNNWNNQGVNSFQTENYQSSPTTTTENWINQGTNNFESINHQNQVTTPAPQTNWNEAVNNLQSQSVTTLQPDWNQESSTNLPNTYQPQQSYTTIFPTENEQTIPPKESQVPAESASFVGNQNSPKFNFQPENYYTQTQTNPPLTTYPVTNSYSNNYSPSGAYSFIDYQRSPNTPVSRDVPTQAPPITTTVLDYTTVNNSTLPPSGETLIPDMINSLQSLSDNSLLYDENGQNAFPSPTNPDDEMNSIALYFNNLKSDEATTVASDLQFNNDENTFRTYTGGISSIGIDSIQTTTPALENIQLPAELTQNTKEAYGKLFRNDTLKESTTMVTTTTTTVTSKTNPANSVNLGFAQGLNLNRSSAEIRELAAVFTRALTAYLDDPENFRKILAEVRPTEPPSVKANISEEQEVLDFSDDSKKQRNNQITSSETSQKLAAEINGIPQNVNELADLSTIVPQYTTSPLIEITSKFTETPKPGIQEYAPLEDSEQLQAAGTQSFYSGRDNSIETGKTLKPATKTLTWTMSPIIDIEQEVKSTTLPPVYFTTNAELETTVIVQKAKEMFSHLNASDAGILMNVMKTAQNNDTVKRLVLLLVNDPNKENNPAQTRNNIIEALLENNRGPTNDQAQYDSSSAGPTLLSATSPGIAFGQRLQEDGSPVVDGHRRKLRKGTRRRVVHRSRSISTSTTPMSPSSWQGANDVSPGLTSDSDARAVELLKSLYSIASKWS